MIKHLLVLLFLTTNLMFGQSWQQLPDYPGTARDDGSSFKIDSIVYSGLGLEVGWTCTNDFYAFDLATETWSLATSFPSTKQRQYATGFSFNGKGYIFGGVDCSGNYLNDIWEFDKSNNSWLQKTSMPSSGRSGCVTFLLNDTIYIVGGKNTSTNALNEVWAYQPTTDTWLQKANIPFNGTWRGIAFSYNNYGIIGLGRNALGQYNRDFYQYHPSTNSWTLINGLTHAGRAYTGFSQLANFGYLFGGIDTLGNIYTDFEKLDLQNFTLTTLTSFPTIARKGCMTFAANDSYYITTGVTTTARLKETWKAAQIVGMDEPSKSNTFSLYPNPSFGNFKIESEIIIKRISIMNLLGATVYQSETNTKVAVIDATLDAGIYSISVMNEKNQSITRKLIIQ